MTHVEQGELQAYLDGEVPQSSRARIEAHINGCAQCAAELQQLRAAARLFAMLVRSSDAAAPTVSALAAVSAARGDVARRRFAYSRSSLAKAAVLLIGFAALASAAIPGSPVRNWISHVLAPAPRAASTLPAAPPVVATSSAPATVSASEIAALSIAPSEGHVLILLSDAASDAVVRIRLVTSDRAMVQAAGAAAHARFSTGPGRVEVVGVKSGVVTIDLPRSTADARVQVDGRTLFQKDGDQVHMSQPATTATDSEFVFRAIR